MQQTAIQPERNEELALCHGGSLGTAQTQRGQPQEPPTDEAFGVGSPGWETPRRLKTIGSGSGTEAVQGLLSHRWVSFWGNEKALEIHSGDSCTVRGRY